MSGSAWKWILGLVLAGAAIYIMSIPQPLPVDTEVVAKGAIMGTVSDDGMTRVRDRYLVYAPISGKLKRVDLEVGDEVVQQQTRVAAIIPEDPAMLNERTRAEAEARVAAAQSRVEQANADLERAEEALAFAKRQLAREEALNQSGAGTQERLDSAKTDVQLREKEVLIANRSITVARQEVKAAKATLIAGDGSPGSVDQRIFEVFAPIDGKVFRILRESEGFITAGTPIMEVADPHDLEVVVDFLSQDAVKMQPGAKVFFKHWGGEEALTGVIDHIEPSGFTKLSALGVEEQRVNVVATFDQPDKAAEHLGDGFRVTLEVVLWEKEEEVLAPTSSLFWRSNQWQVYVAQGETAQLRSVETDLRNNEYAIINSGLTPGDQVIVHPGEDVADGVLIQIN
jgi:HlyD family secretion protein